MNKSKILGPILAVVMMAFTLVGLTTSSASAAPTCQSEQGISSTPGAGSIIYNNPTYHGVEVGDDLLVGVEVRYRECLTENGTYFLRIVKVSYFLSFYNGVYFTGDCGTIGNVTMNPEDIGIGGWDPAASTMACDGMSKTYTFTAPADTRVYNTSTTDQKCVQGTASFAQNPLFGGGYAVESLPNFCPIDYV